MPVAIKMQNQEMLGETNNTKLSQCGGCGDVISDRYYLVAVDRQWHCHCLKCCHCGQLLESQLTCFSRAGLIYCKNDYHKKCVRCVLPIEPKQLVMRINSSSDTSDSQYYHVDCFTCDTCNVKLTKGDYFGKHHNTIYCKYHFQLLVNGDRDKELVNSDTNAPTEDHHQYKPKIKARKKIKTKFNKLCYSMKTSGASLTISPSCSPSSSILSSLSSMGVKRAKRNRTSFKHQQLRSMRAYFNLNHNPDSKDLKQLSLKTGLSKRVLQVWFQNQRAKWRRSLLKQQSLGPQIVQECLPLAELSECHLINSINCDEEKTIIEEELTISTYTNLF